MAKEMKSQTKGILALVFLAVIYAGAGVVTRYLSFYFSFFQQLYLRILIAFVLGLIVFSKSFDRRKLNKISGSEWLLIASRSAATFVFGAVLWIRATTITKLANVAFIDALPITATLSFLLKWEKPTYNKLFLLLMSFTGVIFLSVKDLSNLSTLGFGELLVFISGFFFAFRNLSRRWHSRLLNDAEITQLMFIFGFLMLLLLSFLFREELILPAWNFGWIGMLLLGGVIMIANLYLTNYGFANVSPVLGNNILNLEALFAILFGFIFYGEVSTVKELIGGVMIVISVIAMNRGR